MFFVKVSSVKSRSATPTRIPNLAPPRLTVFQDGVGEYQNDADDDDEVTA